MIDYGRVISSALRKGEAGDGDALEDAFEMSRVLEKDASSTVSGSSDVADVTVFDRGNFEQAHQYSKIVRSTVAKHIKNGNGTSQMETLYKNTLLFDAPYDLDSAIIYAEWDRPYAKKFYEPRRKRLKRVVDAMQKLEERKIHILGVMMPPGVGKTTVEIMYMIWSAFRNPEKGTLMGSHSISLLRGVYDEVLRMLQPGGEYKWLEIFPTVPFAGTNSRELQIDVGKRKRFSSFQFASVGSGNAGRVRASNLLVLDDLVDGIESAMSRDRMDKLWQQYNTDYLQRQMDDCGQLLVATPWSLHDPIDRLERAHENDPDVEFIHLPALNEDDESNFDYPCGVGFSTEYYHELRDIMDDASWRALFMTEPIEREGVLYSDQELRRYFDLPEEEPDAVFAVCDTKTTGSDYCVLPVCYQYGNDFYIADVVCENYAPDAVQISCENMLCRHSPHMAQFESNVAGGKMAQEVQEHIKERGCKTRITTKYTSTNKETKIEVNAPWVKRHCLFLDESKYARDPSMKEYRIFMTMLCGYTLAGKNKHDDAPDAMAQLALYAQSFGGNKIEIVKRPF